VRLLACLSLLACLAQLGGCAEDGGFGADGVVDGPLLTSVGRSEDGMFAEVSGRVTPDGGCLRLGDKPVVWPEGTSWDEASGVLTLPGGEAVPPGGRVSGAGGYLSLRAVREHFGDDVADAVSGCLGPTREVAVFSPGWAVSRVDRPREDGEGVPPGTVTR